MLCVAYGSQADKRTQSIPPIAQCVSMLYAPRNNHTLGGLGVR